MSGQPEPKKEDTFTNVFKNAVAPVDFRFGTQVFGAVEYVVAEMVVSYIVRWLMKTERRTIRELALIHGTSLPFIGGLSAMMEKNHILGYEAPIGDQFMAGGKGVPGLFAGVYVTNTLLNGFHFPKLAGKDILITALCKIVTRPVLSMLYPYISDDMRNGLDVIEYILSKQRINSRLVSEDDPEYVAANPPSRI